MKKLSEETIAKNTPVSRRKAKFYNSIVNLYNSIVESVEETPALAEISDAIENFQDGHYLRPRDIDAHNQLGVVAVKYLPTHRRKIALYTNLVEYINKAVNEVLPDLPDENVSEELKKCADEFVEVVNCAFIAIIEKAQEREETTPVEPTDEDEYDEQPSSVRVSVVIPAELKERFLQAVGEFNADCGGVVQSLTTEEV